MDTSRLLDGFAIELRRQGLSARTARAYAADLGRFLEAVGGPGPYALAPERIARYLDDLARQGSAATTIARRLTSIRRFCHLLIDRGVLPGDPTEDMSVAIPDPEPVQWRREDVEAVLVAPDPYSVIGIRDRAMMMLLADTGMELRELCAMDYRDCREDAQQISVGDGRRLRKIFLYNAHCPLLRYRHFIRDDLDGEALFQSNRGTRISERAVQHRVRQYAQSEGVAVAVENLIRCGRTSRTWGEPKSVARELGFARVDAVQRRYGNPPPEAAAADECDFEHSYLKPLNGMDPRGMPAGRRALDQTPTRCEIWDRLEAQAVQQARLPRPAQRQWLGVTHLAHLPPEERLRAYAKPVARLLDAVVTHGEPQALPEDPRVHELAQEIRASDEVLLDIHRRIVAVDREFSGWISFAERFPPMLKQVKKLRGLADEPAWTDVTVPMFTFGSPDRVLDWADRVLSTREGQDALRRLLGARWPDLMWLRDCAAGYYSVPRREAARRELDAAVVVAAIAGTILCSPEAAERARASEAVENPAGMYFADTVMYVLHQLLRLLALAEDGSVLSGIRDDSAFAEAFEREWDALLPHTNCFFGFAVVPRIHYRDMVRYHRLRYAPHGNLNSIPYEVGDYLVHQAKASGHFLRPFFPEQLHDAFFDCVRPLYGKLLESSKRKVRRALTQRSSRDQDGEDVFDRAEEETEAAFREAYDRYDFYQHPPGGPQTTITEGLLGWRRRDDIATLAAEMGIDCEQARTPFAAYARGHLKQLIKRLQRLSNRGVSEGLRVQAPDEQRYYTINKMARRFKRSTSFLRDLDHLLRPERVRDVFGDHRTGRCGLPGDARLYHADTESVEEYEELLAAQHPRLEAEGLRTEAQVARWLDVDVWWLRNRRKRGLLKAGRMGHFVVYNAAQRVAARELLEEESRVLQET